MLRIFCWITLVISAILIGDTLLGAQSRRVAPVQGRAARLVLTEVLRLGSAFGGEDEFGRLVDVEFGGAGRIYLADDLKHQIVVFDSTGRFLRRTGRRGRGPGEFEAPWNIAVDSRDSVFVWDWKLDRVSVLSPDLVFVRSFPTPGRWALSGFEALPGGNLLVAAYEPGTPGTIHVLSRTGRLVRSIGPTPAPESLPEPLVRNLFGGAVDGSGPSVIYSNKSPYELSFLGLDGRMQRRCTGDPRWTTPPRDVVTITPSSHSIDWPAYVHSVAVLSLGGGFFLNQVADHRRRRMTVDVVDGGCALLERRTITSSNQVFVDRRGDRLVALETDEIPQVIVYRYRVVAGN